MSADLSALSPPIAPRRSLLSYIPALDILRIYRAADARADFVAGLTVATVAVPQAMAYGLVAGVPAEYGLYTAIVMTTVGALFDSSRQLINGPTNATSIAVLSATAMIAEPEARVQAVVLMAFMVGAIQLGITLLRLGDLTRYISHSVIVGFTAGAGSLLVLDQLKNLLGLTAVGDPHDSFLWRFWQTMTQGGTVHGPTLATGLATIGLVLAMRWVKERLRAPLFPELLTAVVIVALASERLGLKAMGVKVIGEIPAKLPHFQLPALDPALMEQLAPSAAAIALLGLLEALAMAKAIAAHTGQRIDLSQQCLSEGLANFSGSFFQCIPGSGSLTRSAINQQAGAATQWSGVWSAGAVALIMLLFAPWAQYIPKAALSGILMLAAWRMIDRRALLFHVRSTRFDAIIVLATAVSAVAISIEFCVLIGMFLSFLLTVPRVGRVLLTEFVIAPDGGIHERLESDTPCPHIRIFGLEGELFFGAASSLEQHLDDLAHLTADLAGERGVSRGIIVLRIKRVRNPDAVGLHLLHDFLLKMQKKEIPVLLCGVRPDVHAALKKSDLLRQIPPDRIFFEQPVRQTSTLLAIRHAYTLLREVCPACPRKDGLASLYYAE